ncbi:WD40/YVTN/BNR-like repeat-containing protein [Marinicella rhabdoformis]|uniref:WD40/YVTN/BNR-like repeat-containing protein n=1 Tax=Marinicella rhabdoformis TaxID=2580566 RepID=UPI0012AEE040|nr:glycosyl hydrolase [Marinicella rhabdoformis]
MRWHHKYTTVLALSAAISAATSGSITTSAYAEADKKNPLASIPLRNIGPAMISGRVSDFAFMPGKKHEFLVATASGNLWKTNNNTITWDPIFDNEGSYSLGVVEIDPNDSNTIWVGTGENNAQRSVAFGDGVYKSTDGGKTWNHMGLKESEHISQIWIDPNDSNTVLVASQGPLWSAGGDRGLFKTTDGGKTWDNILEISKHTGINEFVINKDNPNEIVASSYQRKRHVWALINGGPESAIHRSTDGGKTWNITKSGLPKDHMGRIGLAATGQTIYAVIESNAKEKGIYRSQDFGQSWHKRSSYTPGSPQYYNELIIDPNNPERVYSVNTFTNVSEDGGKTWNPLSIKFRHVDDHALWIDPDNSEHLYIGGDGGIYESYDRGQTWRHVRNLPIAQFYRVTPDNAEPFYNVCGGTQDNNSLCGPSRTDVIHGITNADWHIVLGGDGYEPQIDPNDPNIVYAQYQYGGLARIDRRTKERLYITPHPESGEKEYEWNWNTPLLLSPHNSTRLYYGGDVLFQSDDRGNSWTKISPDLTRQIDRNKLKVMDRVWSVDSIAKNVSTSKFGSLISITESPVQAGVIYTGSDDGQISVTGNGGEDWHFETKFKGVPDMTYVSDIYASNHDAKVAYATFDNHKKGDFKPYVMKTTDQGKTWKSISSDLPARGSAHTIVEDHGKAGLLFVGTEFGVFFSQNDGKSWNEFSALPTIAVRDLEIQQRENDLIIGTFGRGIYILDDYTPLRMNTADLKKQSATIFPVRDQWLYIEGDLYDDREKGSSGSDFFTAPNPTYGATFSYYMNESFESLQKQRRKAEIEKEKDNQDTPYPSWDALRAEDTEDAPVVFAEIKNSSGDVVVRLPAKNSKGFHRLSWNMRYPAPDQVQLSKPSFVPYWVKNPMGALATPGDYEVTLYKRQGGKLSALGDSQTLTLKRLENSPELTQNPAALLAFQQELSELQRAVNGVSGQLGEINNRIKHLKAAHNLTTNATEANYKALRSIELKVNDLSRMFYGDRTVASRQEATAWSIANRVGTLYFNVIESQSDPTANHKRSMAIAQKEFTDALSLLKTINADLTAHEKQMEKLGAPWTPGRILE